MNRQHILNIIEAHAVEVLPELEGHVFDPEESLKQLGANSVDRSEIIMMALESLSLKIALVNMAKAKNIGELADIFYEKLQGN